MDMCSDGIQFPSKGSRRVSGEIRVSNSRCDHVGGVFVDDQNKGGALLLCYFCEIVCTYKSSLIM